MEKIRRAISLMTDFKMLKQLISFYWSGYLYEIGWISSYQQQKPVKKNNDPLPWVTYPYIDFITERLNKSMILFEYGSGNSTVFYSQYVERVFSVEHDLTWFQQLSPKVPSNVIIRYIPLDDNNKYVTFAQSIDDKADIIVVDGRNRVACIKNSVKALSDGGVIVLDDSDREEYCEGIAFLLANGFKKIDFWGISPGIFFRKCTTIFYAEGNCLNL